MLPRSRSSRVEELIPQPVVDGRRHRRLEVRVAAALEGRDAGEDHRQRRVRVEQLGAELLVGVRREAARRPRFRPGRHRLAVGVEPVADPEVRAADELMPVGVDVAEQRVHRGRLDVDVAVDRAGHDRAHAGSRNGRWRPPAATVTCSPGNVRPALPRECQEAPRRPSTAIYDRSTARGGSARSGRQRAARPASLSRPRALIWRYLA